MRYIDKHGFVKNIYYEFIVVDLWTDENDDGVVIPIFRVSLLRPYSGGMAVTISIPWATVGIGFCKIGKDNATK